MNREPEQDNDHSMKVYGLPTSWDGDWAEKMQQYLGQVIHFIAFYCGCALYVSRGGISDPFYHMALLSFSDRAVTS